MIMTKHVIALYVNEVENLLFFKKIVIQQKFKF